MSSAPLRASRASAAALLAAALALSAGSRPTRAAEEPCEPVKPCEIPLDDAPAEAAAPADFAAEVKLLHALAACGGAALPPALARAAGPFCATQSKALSAHRAGPYAGAAGALARLRPAGAPTTVVDPLGRDLLAALAVFPDARSVTTASPVPAGDPRPWVDAGATRATLDALRAATDRVLQPGGPGAPARGGGAARGALGEFVAALAAAGYQPVGLRYFRIAPDGRLEYLTAAQLTADPSAFANSELSFVKAGEDPARPRVHRHLAVETSDAALARSPGVLAHLAAKGRFSAVARGAGDRLSRPDHTRLRELLAKQATFLLSDGGLPPAQVKAAGLVQETHGPLPFRWAGAGARRDVVVVTRRP